MNQVFEELLDIFDLLKSDEDSWTGRNQNTGRQRIFGGQVLGQALVAAWKTIGAWMPHSLHAYFLRPGNPAIPVRYQVHRIRDGKSFATRRIVAFQNECPIFNMSISFQIEEKGFEHQEQMPKIKGPEGLESELERARRLKDLLPESLRYKLTCERPVEIRVVNPINYFQPEKQDPVNYSWIKTISPMPDDPMLHFCMLAYVSDFCLIEACMMPHGVSCAQEYMQIASLDHAMWFHQPFRLDEWLLYKTQSPVSGGARGLNFGTFYRQDGTRVATVVQEALIRNRAVAAK